MNHDNKIFEGDATKISSAASNAFASVPLEYRREVLPGARSVSNVANCRIDRTILQLAA